MEKIHLIMPMGGGGTRFGNKGFNLPKPLIELNGKPFFFWAVQSVIKFMDVKDITFVVLQEHIDNFQIDTKILSFYPEAKIHIIPHVLNGAVLTSCEGVKEIEDDLPILFNDCDHAFTCKDFYDFCREGKFGTPDGALITFNSDNPAYSYAELGDNGNVIKTYEKQVVSNEAICGAYYFKNKNIFLYGVNDYLDNCQYKEFFMSGVFNSLAKDNNIKTFHLDEHISFGTPDEYDEVVKLKDKMEKFI